ncbi:MAG: glycosyltransferase family 4 protein [Deltaproteobacteria bacterium]|nr:MAG: glycosyltransferase family 4 protein [Deltaproteobacteria bacterium]
MRLLYVSADPGVPVFGHKGASVHVRELVTALSAEGARVAIASPRICPEGDGLEVSVDLVELPPVIASTHVGEASLHAAIETQADELLRFAEQYKPEAVYERYSLHSRAGASVATTLGVPHFLEVNAPLRDEELRFRSLSHPELAVETEAYAYGSADRIFAVSVALADSLVRGGARNFVVGFAGSLKPWHGIEVMVDAVRRAAADIASLRLEIVGDGPCARALERLRLSRTGYIMHGARPHGETLGILSSWDVGLAPYVAAAPTFYFCPLKVLEYMAAGVCPVASHLGDIPSLLGDGECGFLVPPGDAPALASTLVELAGDRARAAAVGARARSRARASFSWRRNAIRILDSLHSHVSDSAAYAHT